MDLTKDNKSNYSLNSSRLSQSSNIVPNNFELKRMQAKLLMDYYKQNQQQKQQKYMGQNYERATYGSYEQSLTQNYMSQQQAKRRRKQEIKQKLAEQYDQMIKFKQQKIRMQKQTSLQQEKKNLEMSPWGRDTKQDSIKNKRIQQQYGKELEMHIRLQEIQKYEQRLKEREAVQKFQKQQYELNLIYDKNQLNQYKRKQQFEKRQNQILGVAHLNPEMLSFNHSAELQKNDIRVLKRRQQLLYGTGLQQQLRSQTISPKLNDRYLNKADRLHTSTEKQLQTDIFGSQVYNPITNPMQINYKNPNVLRMLAQHNS